MMREFWNILDMWSLDVAGGWKLEWIAEKKTHLASKQQRVRQSDTQKKEPFHLGDMHAIFLCSSGCTGISSLQRGAHQICLLVSKPHKNSISYVAIEVS